MARPKSPVHVLTGQLGMAVRLGQTEKVEEIRSDLAVERICAYVQRELADSPPLREQQKADLLARIEAVA